MTPRLWMAVLGLPVVVLALVWTQTETAPPAPQPAMTTTARVVVERYARLQCPAETPTDHAVVALKPVLDAALVPHVARFMVHDAAGILLEEGVRDGARYGYADLFRKPIHWEQWRAHCVGERCMVNLNLYVNARELETGRTTDLHVTFYEATGSVLDAVRVPDVHLPSAETTSGVLFPSLNVTAEDGMLRAKATRMGKGPLVLILQTEGTAGYKEDEQMTMEGALSTAMPIPAQATYLAALAFQVEAAPGLDTELKHELMDARGGPASACHAN